ncbi:hypothetical protein [Paenibacillus wynnii]|uniref:hypothetical protein n=1 Tax=Paenibacillus wynnii TaxID=268407 RepID=UPI00278CCC40|nr:hypothetical protein [Paenibacillus wynnii]MDQ0193789.1 hypothetical protein [Paenibacillus wynnii]
MQFYLATLGKALGYKVWVAQNDHKREWKQQSLGPLSIPSLPELKVPKSVADTISFIDVIWLDDLNNIISAFEVEKSTSIYSGILRLHDLSLSLANQDAQLYLICPDSRVKEVQAQLVRPSLQQEKVHNISYILFSDLRCHCDAMCKFGNSMSVLDRISKTSVVG